MKNQTTIKKKVSTAKSWLHPILLPLANGSEAFIFIRAEKKSKGEHGTGMLAEKFTGLGPEKVRDIELSDRCGAAREKT